MKNTRTPKMSSNKYVPPHLRNKPQQQQEQRPRYENTRRYEKPRWQVLEEQEEATRKQNQEQGLEDNETNFPALSTAGPKATYVKKSFAQIAVEGHEKSEQEALKKSVEEKYHKDRMNVPLPRFQNPGYYPEDEDVQFDEQPKTQNDWVTVKRKTRKEKTFEELVQKDEEQQKQREEENTVWYDQESHQTCWDEHY